MKWKKFLIAGIIAIIVAAICIPSSIFANTTGGDVTILEIKPGKCGEGTEVTFSVSRGSGWVNPIAYFILNTATYVGPFPITFSNGTWQGTVSLGVLPPGHHILFLFINEGLWGGPGPILASVEVAPFFDIEECDEEKPEPEPESVRTHPLTCWQVFINDEGNFEFIFFWEYADNNWVKIYDMDGNLVYEIDFSYGKPRFEVDLPDGMYTVRTFHDGFENPIQEFVIGKS